MMSKKYFKLILLLLIIINIVGWQFFSNDQYQSEKLNYLTLIEAYQVAI